MSAWLHVSISTFIFSSRVYRRSIDWRMIKLTRTKVDLHNAVTWTRWVKGNWKSMSTAVHASHQGLLILSTAALFTNWLFREAQEKKLFLFPFFQFFVLYSSNISRLSISIFPPASNICSDETLKKWKASITAVCQSWEMVYIIFVITVLKLNIHIYANISM